MSAKEEPQKNLYFRSELGWAETVVVVARMDMDASESSGRSVNVGILDVDDAMINYDSCLL